MHESPGEIDEARYDRNRIIYLAVTSIIILAILFSYNIRVYLAISILALVLLVLVFLQSLPGMHSTTGGTTGPHGDPRFLIRSMFIVTGLILFFFCIMYIGMGVPAIREPGPDVQPVSVVLAIIFVLLTVIVWAGYLTYIRWTHRILAAIALRFRQ